MGRQASPARRTRSGRRCGKRQDRWAASLELGIIAAVQPPPTPRADPLPRVHAGLHGVPAAILDTQVALDWLLFDDPSTAALARAVQASRLVWLATPAMRAELADGAGSTLTPPSQSW
jgi:hypothetical protein